MEYPHLPNAPIREAIIDIKVKQSLNFNVSEFRALKKRLSKDFPTMEDRNAFTSEVRFGAKKTDVIEKRNELDAIIFKSDDKKEVLQFKKSGLTFNRLEPYTKWEDIIGKARKAWQLYKEISNPSFVTRIATRYINNITLSPNSNLDDYLQNPPKNPLKATLFFSNSLSRDTFVEPNQNINVHLTQAFEPKEKGIAIIIDIDAFKSKQFDLEKDTFWEDFEDLHDMKNKLFFSSLTENAINTYK